MSISSFDKDLSKISKGNLIFCYRKGIYKFTVHRRKGVILRIHQQIAKPPRPIGTGPLHQAVAGKQFCRQRRTP